MKRTLLCTILLLTVALLANAQIGSKSPYSQYGLGALGDQSQSFSRGMNGVGLALRKGNIANTLNPAAYSAIDSLTMLFDVAMAGQVTNYKERGASVNAKGATFEYIVGTFRLRKNMGMTFGVLPYSTIDYEYTTSQFLDNTNGTISESYTGSGGLHQAMLGVGWRIAKPLSIGVNVAYLWGKQNKTVSSSSTTYINSLSKNYSALFNSYNVQVGLQWEQPLSRKDALTLGATYTLGHTLNANANCLVINTNSATSNRDTTTFVVENGFSIPHTFGIGLSYSHGENLFVGADATLQKWGSIDYPDYDAEKGLYVKKGGLLKDRYQVNVGADYVPNTMSRNYFSRVHYRVGAGFATPYYKVNDQDGPKEMSISAGFGLPLQNSWNVRGNMKPVLNISAQWARSAATGLITENTFRINIGLTFNERWFAKWKVN
jgi:hypothetical protein